MTNHFSLPSRRNFIEHRSNFHRRSSQKGLVEEVNAAIVKRQPFPIEDTLRYLLLTHTRTRDIVRIYEAEVVRLPDPAIGAGAYSRAIKGCVDSRPLDLTVLDLIEFPTIHERTAAAVVRNRGSQPQALDLADNGFTTLEKFAKMVFTWWGFAR